MSDTKVYIIIALLALSVMITRFIPFLIFKNTDNLPKIIEYLGKVLPAAMMGLLVIYCFKNVDFKNAESFVPIVASSILVAAVHIFKGNTILSISIGTAAYMIILYFI